MGSTSGSLPHGESELAATGLSAAPSTAITVPRIEEAPVAFECHEWATLEIRSNRMVVGTVPHAHIREQHGGVGELLPREAEADRCGVDA